MSSHSAVIEQIKQVHISTAKFQWQHCPLLFKTSDHLGKQILDPESFGEKEAKQNLTKYAFSNSLQVFAFIKVQRYFPKIEMGRKAMGKAASGSVN
jgi:hypothetical protein